MTPPLSGVQYDDTMEFTKNTTGIIVSVLSIEYGNYLYAFVIASNNQIGWIWLDHVYRRYVGSIVYVC